MLSDMELAGAVDAACKALHDHGVRTVADANRAVSGLMLQVLIAYVGGGATPADLDRILAWLRAEALREGATDA